MKTHEFSDYLNTLSDLALQSLDACDTPEPLPAVHSGINVAQNAAFLLLGDDAARRATLEADLEKLSLQEKHLTDPAGHKRPIYLPLAFTLLLGAWQKCMDTPPPPAAHHIALRMNPSPQADRSVDLRLWQLLCLQQMGTLTNNASMLEQVTAELQPIIVKPARSEALHAHDPEDSLDAWTYRELVGLHALFNLAIRRQDESLKQRCREIANYHLENTQPDNTTNQPWGIAAFLSDPQTASMGLQQLHDAQAQGRMGATSTPATGQNPNTKNVGLVAALLLADATSMLQQ